MWVFSRGPGWRSKLILDYELFRYLPHTHNTMLPLGRPFVAVDANSEVFCVNMTRPGEPYIRMRCAA